MVQHVLRNKRHTADQPSKDMQYLKCDGRSSESVLLGRRLLRCTVFQAGTGGEAVSLPVAGVLAVVTAALGAGVNPDGLSCRNHLTP